ncbi:MAG: peptidylprolyl isomerase [Planctomycetota bacterium]
MRPWLAICLVPVLSLPGLAGPERLTASDLSEGGTVVTGETLAVVDGKEIRVQDLFPVLFLTHTDLMYAALEQAVQRNLMLREVERLDISLDSVKLEENVATVLKTQDDEFKLAAGPDFDFEQFIKNRYGTEPAVYRQAVKNQVLEELFLARLVRYEARLREQAVVRMIVLEDLEVAKEIEAKLKDGANFVALAKAHSIDRTQSEGGLFPPVARDCPHPLLDGIAALEPGQVSGISTIERGGRRLYRLLRLEKLISGDLRPYAEQAQEIEQELEQRAIDPFEIMEWDRRVRERYPIELRLGRA